MYDLTDYQAIDQYEAERAAWFDAQYPPLTPEELENEHRAMAQDQALRDQSNYYQRRQVDDSIPF